jgi:hypothetical protein
MNPDDVVGYDAYGEPITYEQWQMGNIGYITGGTLTVDEAQAIADNAISQGYDFGVSPSTITIPGIISDSAAASIAANLSASIGTAAGKWLAKKVGGNTVLYRQQAGGIGTFNIQNLLLPGAVIFGLVMLSKKG